MVQRRLDAVGAHWGWGGCSGCTLRSEGRSGCTLRSGGCSGCTLGLRGCSGCTLGQATAGPWCRAESGCTAGRGKGRPRFLPPTPADRTVTPGVGAGRVLGGWPHPDKFHEGVVDVGTAGQEEAAAGAELVEEEKLLLLRWRGGLAVTGRPLVTPPVMPDTPTTPQRGAHLPDAPVIAQGGLILRLLPGGQITGTGEGDGSDALQRRAAPGSPPERSRALPGGGRGSVGSGCGGGVCSLPPRALPHI